MHRLIAVLMLAVPSVAHANGAFSHVHMSQLAADGLDPGPLRELLAVPENRAALESGSMFPDSGYAIDDGYGEIAHWEPFLSALIAQLRSVHGDDFSSSEAARQVAFLLGVASHGLADQTYDTTLLERGYEVDGPEDSEHPVDQYADYFLAIDQGFDVVVDPWTPTTQVVPAVGAVGHTVSATTLMDGMRRMAAVIDIQTLPRVAQGGYWDAWASYPFLGTHVYNPEAVGSLPWVAARIAEYWAVLWERLHGTDNVDERLVIATTPEDGGLNWPVDLSASAAWGRPAIWFGYGIDREQLTPLLSLRVAATGEDAPFTVETAYNGRNRNLVFVRPTEPLAYDTEYDVELAPGVETLDGRTTTETWTMSFRTRCSAESLEDCPSLAPPLVTGTIPERPRAVDAGPVADAGTTDAGTTEEPGGCAVRPGRAPGTALLAGMLLALVVGRRLRRR